MVSIDKTRAIHTHTRTTRGGGWRGQCHRTQTRTQHERQAKSFWLAIIIPCFPFFSSPLHYRRWMDGWNVLADAREGWLVGEGYLSCLSSFVFLLAHSGNILRWNSIQTRHKPIEYLDREPGGTLLEQGNKEKEAQHISGEVEARRRRKRRITSWPVMSSCNAINQSRGKVDAWVQYLWVYVCSCLG
jgi:hypothetical protein